jgi:glycosyltransferase involved in cell wall biosynthesis
VTKNTRKNEAEVSVIVPSYNAEETIIQSINSVLRQPYKKIEIIIIDDGSEDKTGKMISEYGFNHRVRYIKQKNKGPGAARNRGIKEANGEYICFLDADDEYLENSILDRLEVFNKYPELGMVFTDNRKEIINIQENTVYRKNDLADTRFLEKRASRYIEVNDGDIYIFKKDIIYELILYCFIWTGTVMTRSQVIKDVGLFDENLRIAEDHDLWLRIAKNHAIGYRDKNTAIYRFHEKNITKNVPLYIDSSIAVRKKYLDKKYNLPEDIKERLKKQLARYHFNKGYYYFNTGELSAFRKEIKKSIHYDEGKIKYFIYFIITLMPANAIKKLRHLKKQCVQKRHKYGLNKGNF